MPGNGLLTVGLHSTVRDVLLNLYLMRFLELGRHQHVEFRHDEAVAVHLHLHLLVVGTHHNVLRQSIVLIGPCRHRDTLPIKGLLFIGFHPTVFGLHDPDLALDEMGSTEFEVVQGIGIVGVHLKRNLINIEGIVVLVLCEKAVAHVIHGIRLQLDIRR